jgi:acetyl esterase/lipase
MKLKKFVLPLAIVSFGLNFLAHGESAHKKSKAGKPPEANPEMQAVLDVLASLNGKPIPTLSPSEARLQPTPTDAVVTLLQNQGVLSNPQAVASILHLKIPGPIGEIPLNIYMPNGYGPFPVVVYFHGGGFVIADTKVYDSSIRALVNGAEAIVVSVDYHRAPEYKFPNQPNEAYAAYKWVVKNAAQINGDAERIAVAGESAGGNLAAVVSLMARDHKETMPIHQLLIYPVVDNKMSNVSYALNTNAKPLGLEMMKWFFKHYVKQQSDANNPYALPNKAKSLKGLPPTTLITAEIDPLMCEGKDFADRLTSEGVPVAYQHYEGVTHEFFGMAAVLEEAKAAQAFVSGELKKAFSTIT